MKWKGGTDSRNLAEVRARAMVISLNERGTHAVLGPLIAQPTQCEKAKRVGRVKNLLRAVSGRSRYLAGWRMQWLQEARNCEKSLRKACSKQPASKSTALRWCTPTDGLASSETTRQGLRGTARSVALYGGGWIGQSALRPRQLLTGEEGVGKLSLDEAQ